MIGITNKFMQDLCLKRDEAEGRVFAFFFGIILLIACLVLPPVFFPYGETLKEISPINTDGYSLNYVMVKSIAESDVTVSEDMFLEIARGGDVFIAPGDNRINYMAKKDGVSYSFFQEIEGLGPFVGEISSIQSSGNAWKITMGRNVGRIVIPYGLFPLIAFIVAIAIIRGSQRTSSPKLHVFIK